jgi:hypothetical protein
LLKTKLRASLQLFTISGQILRAEITGIGPNAPAISSGFSGTFNLLLIYSYIKMILRGD